MTNNKKSRFFPLFVTIIFISVSQTHKANGEIESLYVDDLHSSPKKTWKLVGVTPYLDFQNESYIYTNKKVITGYFEFQNSSKGLGTIESALIFFSCYAEDAPDDDGFELFLNNGSSWYNVGLITPFHNEWGYFEKMDVSEFLQNWGAINFANFYVSYSKVGKANNVFIRSAHLVVDYIPEPFPGRWFYTDAYDLTLKIRLENPSIKPINCILNRYTPSLMLSLELVNRGPEYLKIVVIVKNKDEVVYRKEDYIVMEVGDKFNQTYVLPLEFLRTSTYDIEVFTFRLHKEPLRADIRSVKPPSICFLFRLISVCAVLFTLSFLIYTSNL